VPGSTFTDPTGEKLACSATQADGQALPGWLAFDPTTGMFTGSAPATAQSVDIAVTATDTSGLSASETFLASVLGLPVVTQHTPHQTWTEGSAFSLSLPANTFADRQGESLVYSAMQANGQALPSWLQFNAATDSFSGIAPATAQTVDVSVTAADTSGLAVSEAFSASVQAPGTTAKPGIAVTAPTPAQSRTDGEAVNLTLPANTFKDALGLKMTFAAYQMSGPDVTSWLYFNPATNALFGASRRT
jgi:hypothetical protein